MNARWMCVIGLWLPVVGVGVLGWTVFVRAGELQRSGTGQAVFITMAGLAAPALSTIMVRRHPDEWTGPLLGVCVFAAMFGFARIGPLEGFSQVAGVVALVTVLLPAVVALNYPPFGCPERFLSPLRWCGWASVGAGAVTGALVLTGSVPGQWWDTTDPGPAGTTAMLSMVLYSLVVLAGLTIAVIAALFRYRAMPGGGRAALRPLVVPLIAWAAATAAATGWMLLGGLTEPQLRAGRIPSTAWFTMLPTLLVAVLAAGIWWIDTTIRLPAGQVGPDGRRRSRDAWETRVEQYLSRALADPSIRVLYPVPGDRNRNEPAWADARGRRTTVDESAPDRSVTVIRRGDEVIGLIEQDAANTARPDAVELVATGAGLLMETERLTAAARSDLDRSRDLASRLLSASDQPRAELRSALLAGPLRELADVAADLQNAVPLTDVAPRLTVAAGQVRTLSHGVFPPALTEGGLRAAMPRAVVPERRYPPVVEMTAYLAAHADPSATITQASDGPQSLQVRTTLPPDDTLRDRVIVLGGRIDTATDGWLITVPTAG